ncbi:MULTISPECIES: hypothetical protein [Hafnia]|jgi:hypothetical protein|uniref:hypothetical protein n=1 Tax=Hafnia TaxID=568 RepID=UPI001034A751|nr:hypothetical protein [Hafnia paralvei]TBL63228.1 hypothetical protein EYY97_07555 [Hafnia paralvei]
MAKFLRNSLIGILSLSVVGCANFSGDDFKTLGALVLIVGVVAAIAVSDSGDDSNYDSSDNYGHHDYHHDDKHHHHEH